MDDLAVVHVFEGESDLCEPGEELFLGEVGALAGDLFVDDL